MAQVALANYRFVSWRLVIYHLPRRSVSTCTLGELICHKNRQILSWTVPLSLSYGFWLNGHVKRLHIGTILFWKYFLVSFESASKSGRSLPCLFIAIFIFSLLIPQVPSGLGLYCTWHIRQPITADTSGMTKKRDFQPVAGFSRLSSSVDGLLLVVTIGYSRIKTFYCCCKKQVHLWCLFAGVSMEAKQCISATDCRPNWNFKDGFQAIEAWWINSDCLRLNTSSPPPITSTPSPIPISFGVGQSDGSIFG